MYDQKVSKGRIGPVIAGMAGKVTVQLLRWNEGGEDFHSEAVSAARSNHWCPIKNRAQVSQI